MVLKINFWLAIILFFVLTIWGNSAWAIVRINDIFTAQKTCEAVQSIKTQANPGTVQISPKVSYPVIGKNQENGSYYLIKIEGAKPPVRWVSIECGQLSLSPPSDLSENRTNLSNNSRDLSEEKINLSNNSRDLSDERINLSNNSTNLVEESTNQSLNNLLAISWQPSFCETEPKKPECVGRTDEVFEAKNLTIHGLWPQPKGKEYCNVSKDIKELDQAKRWSELPPIKLSPQTLAKLKIVMPGVASNLHIHEWYKHGTCYNTSPEEYFQDTIAVLEKVNQSQVRDLLVANIGEYLTSSQIRKKFDQAFGNGAGRKVQVKCENDIDEDKQKMITELWVNLKGNIKSDTKLDALLSKAPNVPIGCPGGEVDPIGINEKLIPNVR